MWQKLKRDRTLNIKKKLNHWKTEMSQKLKCHNTIIWHRTLTKTLAKTWGYQEYKGNQHNQCNQGNQQNQGNQNNHDKQVNQGN